MHAGMAAVAIAAASFVCAPCQAQEAAAAPVDSPKAAPQKFMINAFDVAGVSSVPQGEIEKIVYPFMGPDRTGDDVEAARKAIQDSYAARGYEAAVVEIPTQPDDLFSQGIVRITVNEVPVGRVRVVGAKHIALSPVRERVPSLVEGKPLNLKSLQGDLSSANRSLDGEVTPSFRAGIVPGTMDVDLRVKDNAPFHGSLQLDNDASPSTSPLRLAASVRYTNLWQAAHTLSLTYIVAPQHRSETEVFAASYSAPIANSPWSLLLYGYHANSNVAALAGTSVLGNGYQVGLRASYHLPATTTSQSLSFGFDYKDFKQNIFVGTAKASNAPLRYIPFAVDYTISGGGQDITFDGSLGATLGVRAIKRVACFDPQATPATCIPEDQFRNRDFDSNENFVHVNATFNISYATPDDFVMAVRLAGQLADSHLVTTEQFAVGGLNTVRGYFQAETVGDDGVTGSLELRLPSLVSKLGDVFDEFRPYAFVEDGYVHIRRVLPDQKSDYTIGSVGGGLRVRLFKYLSGSVDVGVPVRDGPNSKRGDPRVTFVAKGEF